MILCGGSATDLPQQGPQCAALFNTVDSFDNHSSIPQYFQAMDTINKQSSTASIISVGWDPGLFSLNRLLFQSCLPAGENYTFWGKGVSQGHSDAIRRVEGVQNGIQYTIPVKQVIDEIRAGNGRDYATREKHQRECFVVATPGADLAKIEQDIKTMPAYFADYDTTVHFISEDELKQNHTAMPHGGFVIRSGETAAGTKQLMEFSLALDSNPQFTSSILVAYARALHRMVQEGGKGAKTVFDVPFSYLSPKDGATLRAELL